MRRVRGRRVAPWAVAFILAGAAGPATASSATAAADHAARQPSAAEDGHRLTFGRVVLIVFENKPASAVLGNPAAPTFNRLARRYASLTRYFAITHPSLPNYLALVSGSTHGITSDCTDCAVDGRNLADTLATAGKSWKTYAEGLPRPGFTGAFAGRYAKKHNPLLYFRDVLVRPARLRRIVPLSHFARDLAAGVPPDFSLVVPDLCHDMHDCPVATGDAWLRRFLRPVLGSGALRDGVVFVVFDEDDGAQGNHVAALALGPLVRPGSSSRRRLDHYALLRTIEDGLGLPRLGRSASARAITGIWRATAAQRSRSVRSSASPATVTGRLPSPSSSPGRHRADARAPAFRSSRCLTVSPTRPTAGSAGTSSFFDTRATEIWSWLAVRAARTGRTTPPRPPLVARPAAQSREACPQPGHSSPSQGWAKAREPGLTERSRSSRSAIRVTTGHSRDA